MKLTVRKRDSSLYITIPSQVAKATGIQEGDVVEADIRKVRE